MTARHFEETDTYLQVLKPWIKYPKSEGLTSKYKTEKTIQMMPFLILFSLWTLHNSCIQYFLSIQERYKQIFKTYLVSVIPQVNFLLNF